MAEVSGPYWEFAALLRLVEQTYPDTVTEQRIAQAIASTVGLTHLEFTFTRQTESGEFVLDIHIGPQFESDPNKSKT